MPPKKRYFVDETEVQAVIEAYQRGLTICQVKAELCLLASPMTIERLLKAHGVIRKPGTQRIDALCACCGQTFVGKAYNNYVCRKCVPNRSWEQRFSLYGVGKPQFKALWQKQSGLCDLCELPLPKVLSQIYIDHCHKQGHVRALLHPKCNMGLHYIEDDKYLAQAVRYIERHRL